MEINTNNSLEEETPLTVEEETPLTVEEENVDITSDDLQHDDTVDPIIGIADEAIKEKEREAEKSDPSKIPDFFYRELSSGGKDNLHDIIARDSDLNNYQLLDKSYYTEDEKLKTFLANKGIEDVGAIYDVVARKFDELKKTKLDVEKLTSPLVYKHAYSNLFKTTPTSNENLTRLSTLEETGLNDFLTIQEIAQARGTYGEDGLLDASGDDKALDVALGKVNLRVSRTIDEENNLRFNVDENGFYYTEEFDNSERIHSMDNVVKVFNSGVFKDTWFDSNVVDESLWATTFRRSPQIAALASSFIFPPAAPILMGVASLGFFADAASGAAELTKSAGAVLGIDNEKWLNKFQNYLEMYRSGQTYEQMENPWGVQNLVSQTLEMVGQVGGMGIISKMGAKGVKGLSKTLKLTPAGSTANTVGNRLGLLSMASTMSEQVVRAAKESKIDEKDIPYLHIGSLGGFMLTANISKALWNPSNQKLLDAAAYQSSKTLLKNMTGKALEKGKDSASGMIGQIVRSTNKMADYIAKKSSGSLSNIYSGFLMEGGEEVAETAWENIIKHSYNLINADKKANQGRFRDVKAKDVMHEAAMAFVYGGIAGGLLSTKAGKIAMFTREKAELMDQTQSKDYSLMLLSKEGEEAVSKADIKLASGYSQEKSFAKDKDGEFKDVDSDSADPLASMSQREFVGNLLNSRKEYVKDLIDYKMIAMSGDSNWRENVGEDLKNFSDKSSLEFNKDIIKNIKASTELDAKILKAQKGETVEEKNTVKAFEKDKEEIDNNLKEIISGKRNSFYKRQAIFKGLNTPLKLEQYNELNEELDVIIENNKEVFDNIETAVEERSKSILSSSSFEDIKSLVAQGPISEEAREHIEKVFTNEENILKELEEVKPGIIAQLGEALNKEEIDKEQYDKQKARIEQATKLEELKEPALYTLEDDEGSSEDVKA
jgi:hypothetical protein